MKRVLRSARTAPNPRGFREVSGPGETRPATRGMYPTPTPPTNCLAGAPERGHRICTYLLKVLIHMA